MIKTKKSLGQNFLKDKGILQKIANFAHIEKEDTVVEVGPGKGSLTEFILERAGKVIAIEKDERMVEFLTRPPRIRPPASSCEASRTGESVAGGKKNLADSKLEIISGDILDIDFNIFPKDYVLVGNIPYYITGALFKMALESKNPPKSITFVVQKEVAERIMAKDGKESILSISIKTYGTPEYGGIIKAGSFSPKPKVDSAIIAVRNINRDRFKEITPPTPLTLSGAGNEKKIESKFFEILKAGFAHKRKLLIRNLEKFGATKEIFEKCGLPKKARAENLKVADWICLTKELAS